MPALALPLLGSCLISGCHSFGSSCSQHRIADHPSFWMGKAGDRVHAKEKCAAKAKVDARLAACGKAKGCGACLAEPLGCLWGHASFGEGAEALGGGAGAGFCHTGLGYMVPMKNFKRCQTETVQMVDGGLFFCCCCS